MGQDYANDESSGIAQQTVGVATSRGIRNRSVSAPCKGLIINAVDHLMRRDEPGRSVHSKMSSVC